MRHRNPLALQAGKLAFQEKKERYFKPNKVMAKSFTNIPLTDMMMHAGA